MTLPDRDQLLAQWEALGEPTLELGEGYTLANLAQFLHAYESNQSYMTPFADKALETIRQYLKGHQP